MSTTDTEIDPIVALRRNSRSAQLWDGLLRQKKVWIPGGAWESFCAASLRGYSLSEVFGNGEPNPATTRNVICVVPDFDVPGAVRVRDMDDRYRATALKFLWRKSAYICTGLSWQILDVGDMSENAMDAIERELNQYAELAFDEVKRREWFEAQPLVQKLRKPQRKA